MDDKVRTAYDAVAKIITLAKMEPYIEIRLPSDSFNSPNPYDPELVIQYKLYGYNDDGTRGMHLYEYEKAYLRPSKAVSELREHKSHYTCPACSTTMCEAKFLNNYGQGFDAQMLLCTCRWCGYKWLSKPDHLR